MTVKEKFFEGLGNIGKTFPTIGKVVGTTMILKSVGKLKKPTKNLLKGGYKL